MWPWKKQEQLLKLTGSTSGTITIRGQAAAGGYSRTSRFDYWARLYEDALRTMQSSAVRQYYWEQMELERARYVYDDTQAVRRDAIQRVRDSGIFEPPVSLSPELPPAEPKDELSDRFRELDL